MKFSFTIRSTNRSQFALLALLPSLLIPAVAGAIEGDEPARYAPGTRAERVAHPAIQERLDQAPVWQEFLDRRGGVWTAQWDEATRTPVRFWGTGWDVGAATLADDSSAMQAAWQILSDESDLLGDVDLADVRDGIVDRRNGITTVTFVRTWAGLPVEDARVSLRFKHGRFVMGQFESFPGIGAQLPAAPGPGIGKVAARAAALEHLGWDAAKASIIDDRLVVLPLASAQDVTYRIAWRVEVRSQAAPSHRLVYVDARDGSLLRWDELVRFAAAEVRADVDDRWPENGRTTRPMAGVELTTPLGDIEVGHDGAFDVPAELAGEVTWSAGSRYFDVRSHDGGGEAEFAAQLTAEGGTLLAAPADDLSDTAERRVLAQLGVHVAAHTARQRALDIDPDFVWADYRVDANVNIEGNCNAYFDGNINFLRQGGGCNNTARVHDVVAHEYGHGFHAYSIIEGVGAFDGALSEGLGDYMAATISGDPATARGFFRGSDAPLRDIAPNHVWPDDVGEIHYTGIIIAGALWDTRTAMVAQYGEAVGVARADALFGAIAARATDIPSSYAEALLENDDDGNLGNGTPDQCLIDDEFGRHGLGPGAPGSALFAIELGEVGGVAAGEPLPIALTAELARPDCTTGDVGEVLVHWTHGSGDVDDFHTLTLDALGGGAYGGAIPAAAAGTLVRYTVELIDSTGAVGAALPTGSITDPWFAAWVGGDGWSEVYFEDFEADDGGYTHVLLEGPDQEGADDWQWGTPTGQGGDPLGAYSGDNAWGNDLAMLDNWNGLYQPGVHNVLRSPSIAIPAGATAVELQFRRWLNVEDGFWDNALVRVNGQALWTQYAGPNQDDSANHHADSHWALRSYDVTDLVQAGGTLEVEWELITDAGLQLGGWNLDDVAVQVFVPGAGVGPDGQPIEGGGLEGSGCGCSAGADAPASLLALLLFVLPFARRRR